MTPEMEMARPALGICGGGVDAITTHAHKTMSELSTSNGVQVRVQGSHVGRSCHQGRGGQGRHFNHPAYTSPIRDFREK